MTSNWGRREVSWAFCAAKRRLKTNLRTPNSLLTGLFRACPWVPRGTQIPKFGIYDTFKYVWRCPAPKIPILAFFYTNVANLAIFHKIAKSATFHKTIVNFIKHKFSYDVAKGQQNAQGTPGVRPGPGGPLAVVRQINILSALICF